MLVFGVLGGFVRASLDYDQLVQKFDFRGGQVAGYATYLSGGLFVDTLLNAHLLELDPNSAFGNHGSLDANTVGLRTDTGYRFGSFSGGAFIEPLATIAVTGPRSRASLSAITKCLSTMIPMRADAWD